MFVLLPSVRVPAIRMPVETCVVDGDEEVQTRVLPFQDKISSISGHIVV